MRASKAEGKSVKRTPKDGGKLQRPRKRVRRSERPFVTPHLQALANRDARRQAEVAGEGSMY